jgi:hypothetical protein
MRTVIPDTVMLIATEWIPEAMLFVLSWAYLFLFQALSQVLYQLHVYTWSSCV